MSNTHNDKNLTSIPSTVDDITLNVLDIIDGTIVDGPGLRTSIYIAGCHHRCPECHNSQSWDFNAGTPMTIAQIMKHVIDADSNVTLTGGDPLYSIDKILPLCHAIHQAGKTIWLFTGYTIEEIRSDASLIRILDVVDAIVDGPFEIAKRDISLRFRGSSNQRIILKEDFFNLTPPVRY